MLVLSRKKSEVFDIGNNGKITVLERENGCVLIGIEAPREIPIVREELLIKEMHDGTR